MIKDKHVRRPILYERLQNTSIFKLYFIHHHQDYSYKPLEGPTHLISKRPRTCPTRTCYTILECL